MHAWLLGNPRTGILCSSNVLSKYKDISRRGARVSLDCACYLTCEALDVLFGSESRGGTGMSR